MSINEKIQRNSNDISCCFHFEKHFVSMRFFGFVFLVFFAVSSASAKNKIINYSLFAGGVISSIGIHELGHAGAMKIIGGEVEKIELFNDGILSGRTVGKLNNPSKRQLQFFTASGLLTASLAAEMVINVKSMHDNAFAQGMLTSSIISNIWHVKNYYFKRVGVDGWPGNDIDFFEMSGGNPHVFSAFLLSYSAFSLYRIERNTDIFPLIKMNLSF